MQKEPDSFRAFAAARYDLTKAALFMLRGHWRLWCGIVSLGRFAVAIIWR